MYNLFNIQSTFQAMLKSYSLFGEHGEQLQAKFGLTVALNTCAAGRDIDTMFREIRTAWLADMDTLLATAPVESRLMEQLSALVLLTTVVREAAWFSRAIIKTAEDFTKLLRTTEVPTITVSLRTVPAPEEHLPFAA